jgi:hypothetical protein
LWDALNLRRDFDFVPTVLTTLRNQALVDYFRCPEGIGDFVPAGDLSSDSGFFKFGPEVICYGQSSSGVSAQVAHAGLHDSLHKVSVADGMLHLPFDPEQVLDNLRCERYADHTLAAPEKSLLKSAIRGAYYVVRPVLPVPIRRHMQSFHLKGRRKIAFPAWPVDLTVENLMEKLLLLSLRAHGIEGVPFIWFWPEGFQSCAIMTHDVEAPQGRNFCTNLMDINDSAGIKSSFQVVPEERYPVPESFLDEIRLRGFEVNVHDLNHDGKLYQERELFLRRVQRINQYGKDFRAIGFRSGALYRNPDWYDAFDFSYDLSIPNAGQLEAQHGGCCTVMPFFVGGILELPLTTTQDYSLFQILRTYSIDLWKKEIALIQEKHGLISFIVHPDYIIEERAQKTYKSLLDYLVQLRSGGKIWITLPREVNDWWRQRTQMKLVSSGGDWHIEGPGSERAKIAYAVVDGDKISFQI